jgi:hypothetical protein
MTDKKPRRSRQIFTVKTISEFNIEADFDKFRYLRYKNFISIDEIFTFKNSFSIIFMRMQISLDHVIASLAYPNKPKLASIIWQVNIIQYLKEVSYQLKIIDFQ